MKKIIFTALFVVSLLAFMCITAGAAQYVSLTPVDFPVVVNGNMVDNNQREYPFICYNSITYFPMTYEDCALLGVENTWTPETGNSLTQTTPSGQYRSYISPVDCTIVPGTVAMIADTPITVMGTWLNNAVEQYPVLNYKNVLYFPLTYNWGQAFGWTIDFHPNRTLEVTTADFEDKGSYFVYKFDGDQIEKIKNSVTDKSQNKFYNNDVATNSPDYTFGFSNKHGFVPVYRFLPSKSRSGRQMMSVNASLLPLFEQYGWFAVSNPYGAIAKFAETERDDEIYSQLQFFVHCISGKSSEEIAALKELQTYVARNYTTLYASNGAVRSVLTGEVPAYNAVGWMDASSYLRQVIWQNESIGNHYGALRILEYYNGTDFGADLAAVLPDIDYYDISEDLWAKKDQLLSYLEARQKQDVAFGHAGVDKYGSYSITLRVNNDLVSDVEIYYTIVDTAGNFIASSFDTVYIGGVSDYCPVEHHINSSAYYNFGGVKNVTVSKVNYYDRDYLNMALGKG